MVNAQLIARLREVFGLEGQRSKPPHLAGIAQPGEFYHRAPRECDACVIINRHAKHLPANAADQVPAIARFTMCQAFYTAEIPGVDVQLLA